VAWVGAERAGSFGCEKIASRICGSLAILLGILDMIFGALAIAARSTREVVLLLRSLGEG
jgi:hypothetical protein